MRDEEAGDEPTPVEVAEYVSDIAGQLAAMAQGASIALADGGGPDARTHSALADLRGFSWRKPRPMMRRSRRAARRRDPPIPVL